MLEGSRTDMHGFSSFHDLIIQEQLLDADDDIFAKEILNSEIIKTRWRKNCGVNSNPSTVPSNVLNINGNKTSNSQKVLRDSRTGPLCGWYVDPNVVYRKNNGPSKSKGVPGRELNRDFKNKGNTPQDYIFRHYTNLNLYIEQYRQDHVSLDTANSSADRNDVGSEYPPLAACSEITTSPHNTAVPFFQQEDSTLYNALQQVQTYQKPQQCFSGQYLSKLEQQRQTLRARNLKKPYSSSSTSEIARAAIVPEQSYSTGHAQRVSSAKAAVFATAAADTAVKKSQFGATKIPTSKVMSTKIVRLLGPGSPLNPDCRGVDSLADSSGSGTEKESSGVQATGDIPKIQLELCSIVREQTSKPEPAQLFMTSRHDEHLPRTTTTPMFSETPRLVQPNHGNNNGSDAFVRDARASSCHQSPVQKVTPGTGRMPQHSQPKKGKSLLTITGQDCWKTKKCVYDRWTVAKKEDEKSSILAHNSRIRQLIDQTKIKYKFGQNSNQSKPVLGRRFLEINSINITDPFVTAVPCSSKGRCMNEQINYNGSCSILTEATATIRGSPMGVVGSLIHLAQNKIPALCEEMPDSVTIDKLESVDCFHSGCHFTNFQTSSLLEKNCGNQETTKAGMIEADQNGCYFTGTNFQTSSHLGENYDDQETNKAGMIEADQSLFQQSTHGMDNRSTKCGQAKIDKSWENNFESYVPASYPGKMCKDNCYSHRLAEEVSTLLTFTLPKVNYSKFPLACRSQSVEF